MQRTSSNQIGRRPRRDGARGFALVELVMTLVVVGIVASVVVPRLKVSPTRHVRLAARQILNDLDAARTMALAAKRGVRIDFDVKKHSYVRYVDEDGNGVIGKSKKERLALRGRGVIKLRPGVTFGRGAAGPLPGDATSRAVTFEKEELELDSRGVTVPFGTRGAIYLTHESDPNAVAAISVSGSASFKLWIYREGMWQ